MHLHVLYITTDIGLFRVILLCYSYSTDVRYITVINVHMH